MSLLHAENKEEFDKILEEAKGKVVAVDFFATWCPPCVRIGPIFKGFAESGDYPNGKIILSQLSS